MGRAQMMTPAEARAARRSDNTLVIDMPNARAAIGHNSGEVMLGGGLEGASRQDREMALWRPNFGSPDQIINGVKDIADARSRDMVQNDGYATGAVQTHRDSIVGSIFRLNCQPEWAVMGLSDAEGEAWNEEFQTIVESRFNLTAESNNHWLDAARRQTLTEMLRLSVGAFVYTGEVCASVEWIRESNRPCSTAIQLISPDRLTNPNNIMDGKIPGTDRRISRGIETDFRGRHLAYNIRNSHPGTWFDFTSTTWKRVEAEKPWGRKQFLYINEPLQIEQSRGVADMVSVLKLLKMTKQYSEVTLQNAVINASYAAAVESEAPNADIITALGGGQDGGYEKSYAQYLSMLGAYIGDANNISIDGAKIPHLFPGTKLSLKPVGTPGGIGTNYEASLLRKIAAALGVSYEELARDYSKVSYSSARASMQQTWRFMQSRKKIVADKLATMVYTLWLEEEIGRGNVPLPPRWTRSTYYDDPLMAEAISQCTWIGSGRGQIDELKETQAAILRIKSGLSTYEEESARLGNDFRRVFAQRAREEKIIKKYGLAFSLDAQKSTQGQGTQQTLQDNDDAEDDAVVETEDA